MSGICWGKWYLIGSKNGSQSTNNFFKVRPSPESMLRKCWFLITHLMQSAGYTKHPWNLFACLACVFGTPFHWRPSKRKPHQYGGRVALSNVFIWQTANTMVAWRGEQSPGHKDKLRRSYRPRWKQEKWQRNRRRIKEHNTHTCVLSGSGRTLRIQKYCPRWQLNVHN